jgi:hypothetical protein
MSITMEAGFCVKAVEKAMAGRRSSKPIKHGVHRLAD